MDLMKKGRNILLPFSVVLVAVMCRLWSESLFLGVCLAIMGASGIYFGIFAALSLVWKHYSHIYVFPCVWLYV